MLTYQQLIIDPRGRDIAKRLVTNVVNQQISQDLSVSYAFS
jgi:FixJ family two-component response regulator